MPKHRTTNMCKCWCVRFWATPHNLTRRLSRDFCPNSKFGKRRNTVCTRKGYAASVSQLALATAAQYFSFFKLKKWGKKAAETRRHNCAVLPLAFFPFAPQGRENGVFPTLHNKKQPGRFLRPGYGFSSPSASPRNRRLS